MPNIRYEHRDLTVACALGAGDAAARADEWRKLRQQAGLGAEPIPAGARLWLRPEARVAVEDLLRREAGCCAFLDLRTGHRR